MDQEIVELLKDIKWILFWFAMLVAWSSVYVVFYLIKISKKEKP